MKLLRNEDDFQPRREDLSRLRITTQEAAIYGLHVNDLLVNRVNSPSHLGKVLVVPKRLCPAVFESNMMRFRVTEDVHPPWLGRYLASASGRKRLTARAKWAVNQASINQGDVMATPVPLPPLLEQGEIVRRVEALFKLADAIDTRVAPATQRADKLI